MTIIYKHITFHASLVFFAVTNQVPGCKPGKIGKFT